MLQPSRLKQKLEHDEIFEDTWENKKKSMITLSQKRCTVNNF